MQSNEDKFAELLDEWAPIAEEMKTVDRAHVWVNDFLDSDVRRLSNIQRYNNTPTLIRENVAEHSYYVAVTAMALWDYLAKQNEHGLPFNMPRLEEVLRRALMHDFEESFSGDAPAQLKVRHPHFKESFRKINIEVVTRLLHNVPDPFKTKYFNSWFESKSDDQGIVAIADKLSAAFYAMQELRMGNQYYKEVLGNIIGLLIPLARKHNWFKPILKDLIHRIEKEFAP